MLEDMLGAAIPFNDERGLFVICIAVIAFLATSSRAGTRRCRNCREVNRPQAVYCAQCGRRLRGK